MRIDRTMYPTPPRPLFAWVFAVLLATVLTAAGCSSGCGAPSPKPTPKTAAPQPAASKPSSPAAPPADPTAEDDGDTLISGSIGDIINLIYFLSADAGSHEIANLIYDSLIAYDKDMNFAPRLAESWEVSEDKKTITFHLRKDVKWQDGEPFDVKDVDLTFQAMIHKDTPNPYAEDYLLVQKFEVVDPYTFRVTYAEPYAPAMESWANFSPLPAHILKQSFSQEANHIVDSTLKDAPVGNGPFKLAEWKRGQYILLERNESNYKGRFHLAKYQFRIVADLSTMFNELRAGGLDEMGLTPQQFVKQAQGPEFTDKFNFLQYAANGYSYLGFNLTQPLFQDKKVRQAIAYAINQKDIIDGVFLGQAVPATGPYVPETRWHNPNVRTYPHDPEKAKALLAEVGWKDADGDGVLEKDGKKFAFTLITNAGNEVRKEIATVIQANLKEVGIQIEIRTLEWATFLKEFINKTNYDAFILGWSLGMDPDQYLIWHSSQIKEGALNHVHFSNAEVDRLLEEGRHELDLEKRRAIYWKMQDVLAEELPYVFLAVSRANEVVDKRFRGVSALPLRGVGYSFMQNEWFVPKALHKYP